MLGIEYKSEDIDVLLTREVQPDVPFVDNVNYLDLFETGIFELIFEQML